MSDEITSIPSVDSFLEVCTVALPVLQQMNTHGLASALSIKSSRRTLCGLDVITCIVELEREAKRLRKLQDIVGPFVGIDLPYTVKEGLASPCTRKGMFTPEAFLYDLQVVFAKWKCKGGPCASELKCADGYALFNLANEFKSFERAAKALNAAQTAGCLLLDGDPDPALQRRIKCNLRKVVDLHKKEFSEITEIGSADKKSSHFVLEKRIIYNMNRRQLKQLAAFWDVVPEDNMLAPNPHVCEDANPQTENPADEEPSGDDTVACTVLTWLNHVSCACASNDSIANLAANVLKELTDPHRQVLNSHITETTLPEPIPSNAAAIGQLLKQMLSDLRKVST